MQQVAAKEGTITLMVLTNVKDSPAITVGDAEMHAEQARRGRGARRMQSVSQRGSRSCTVSAEFLDLDVTALQYGLIASYDGFIDDWLYQSDSKGYEGLVYRYALSTGTSTH